MLAAARIMAELKKEITGRLVRESGGTLAKAEPEWQLVRAGIPEAASIPHRVTRSSVLDEVERAVSAGGKRCSAASRPGRPGYCRRRTCCSAVTIS